MWAIALTWRPVFNTEFYLCAPKELTCLIVDPDYISAVVTDDRFSTWAFTSASSVERRHVISSGIILASHAPSCGYLFWLHGRGTCLHLYHDADCDHLCMVRRKGRNMVHGIQTVDGVCTASDKSGSACRGSPEKKTNRINAEQRMTFAYFRISPCLQWPLWVFFKLHACGI